MSAAIAEPYDDLPPWCPDWCVGEHLEALLEGNEIGDLQTHTGAEHGEILAGLTCSANAVRYQGGRMLRRGDGSGWRAWLTQNRGRSGWDSMTWAHLEVTQGGTSRATDRQIELTMTPAEMLAFGRTLQGVAEAALFEKTVWREGRR